MISKYPSLHRLQFSPATDFLQRHFPVRWSQMGVRYFSSSLVPSWEHWHGLHTDSSAKNPSAHPTPLSSPPIGCTNLESDRKIYLLANVENNHVSKYPCFEILTTIIGVSKRICAVSFDSYIISIFHLHALARLVLNKLLIELEAGILFFAQRATWPICIIWPRQLDFSKYYRIIIWTIGHMIWIIATT